MYTSYFYNFFSLIIITGIVTRILNYFLKKKLPDREAVNLSVFLALILMGPFVAYLLGFDVAIAEFAAALFIWTIIDNLWIEFKKK